MQVAVAGGSGFIGRRVVAALRAAGHTPRVLSRTRADHDVPHVPVDLARDDVPAGALDGCDAIVNLVGIKAGTAADFRAAHVGAVERLVAAARTAAITRFVHVSVVDLGDAWTDYAQTKRAGEAAVAAAGLDHTILRPALVVGPGDDALTNTIRLVRAAPVFVAPRPAPGRLAVIDVEDVADAVVRSLERDVAIGKAYDLVGPEATTMVGLAGRVASALGLSLTTLTLPAGLLRPGAAVLERLGSGLVTRSQLDLLVRGLDGDGAPAAEDLDVHPRRLSDDAIVRVAEDVAGPSLRIWPTPAHRAAIAAVRPAAARLPWFLGLALAAMLAAPWIIASVWLRMAVVEAVLATVAIVTLPLPWRELLRPRAAPIGIGLVAAAVMYVGGALVFAGLTAVWPEAAAQTRTVIAWTQQLDAAPQVPLLVFIVATEDIVWRAAVTMPLAARLGPVAGALAAASLFAIGHLTSGPPILWVAALAAGFAWSLLLLRTRSLVAVIVCHATWDIAVAYLRPYV